MAIFHHSYASDLPSVMALFGQQLLKQLQWSLLCSLTIITLPNEPLLQHWGEYISEYRCSLPALVFNRHSLTSGHNLIYLGKGLKPSSLPIQALLIPSLLTGHYGWVVFTLKHIWWRIKMVSIIHNKPFGLFIYLKVAHKEITVFWRATYLPYAPCQ